MMQFKIYENDGNNTLQERDTLMDLQDAIDEITFDLSETDVVFRLVEIELDERFNEELSYRDIQELDEFDETDETEKFVALFFNENEVENYTDEEIIDLFNNEELTPIYAVKEIEDYI